MAVSEDSVASVSVGTGLWGCRMVLGPTSGRTGGLGKSCFPERSSNHCCGRKTVILIVPVSPQHPAAHRGLSRPLFCFLWCWLGPLPRLQEWADTNVPILQNKKLSLSPFLGEGWLWSLDRSLWTPHPELRSCLLVPCPAICSQRGFLEAEKSPFVPSFHSAWPS